MRKNEKTLLAGVAALALIAGGGLAAAQQGNGMSGTGGAPSMSQGSTGEHTQSGINDSGRKSEGAGGMTAKSPQGAHQSTAQKGDKANSNRSAEERGKTDKDLSRSSEQKGQKNLNRSVEERGKTGKNLNRSAEQKGEKNNHSAEQGAASKNFERENRGATAEKERGRNSRMNSAERRENILKGLQGNASKPMQGETERRQPTGGANIQLSEEQRTKIRETVVDSRSAPRVGHVNFNVSVGTHVPRHIHFAAVPETLVRIQPEWRGYRYFVYEDEIVIVNPHDLSIVAVLPV